METRIKHVAICTENYDRMAEFYKTIFGMKKITNGMTDATGKYNRSVGISATVSSVTLSSKGVSRREQIRHMGKPLHRPKILLGQFFHIRDPLILAS